MSATAKTPQSLSICLRTSEFRGDHAADVQIAYEYVAGETVEDLVKRLELKDPGDWIEIRVVGTR